MYNTIHESPTTNFHLLMLILAQGKIISSAMRSIGKPVFFQFANSLILQPGKFTDLCLGICSSSADCLVYCVFMSFGIISGQM